MAKQGESLEEVMKRFGEVNQRTGFKPRQLDTDADGTILLDPKNPYDVEWYENDSDYDGI